MAAGRPRRIPLTPEEVEELGKELVAWAKVPQTEYPHTRMAQFYSIEKHILRKDWKAIILLPEFLPYYEEAQALLCANCTNTDLLDKAYGSRFIRNFDKELVEEENETMRLKIQLQKEAKVCENDQLVDSIGRIRAAIQGARDKASSESEVEVEQPLLDQGQERQEGAV